MIVKLETSRKTTGASANTQQLNRTLLKNPWVKGDIKRKLKLLKEMNMEIVYQYNQSVKLYSGGIRGSKHLYTRKEQRSQINLFSFSQINFLSFHLKLERGENETQSMHKGGSGKLSKQKSMRKPKNNRK